MRSSISGQRIDETPDYGIRHYSDGALGLFTAGAIVLLLWAYCWLKNSFSWRPPQFINIRFHEVAGLNENAATYVDGVRLGMVDKIQWKGYHNVIVTIKITASNLRIPEGSRFAILTNGIVGAKYIDVMLPPDQREYRRFIDAKTVVIGEDPVRPELTINHLSREFNKVDIDRLRVELSADSARLRQAADSLLVLSGKTSNLIDRTLPLTSSVSNLVDRSLPLTANVSRLIDRSLPLTADVSRLIDRTGPLESKLSLLVDNTIPLECKVSSLVDRTLPLESKLSNLVDCTIPLEGKASLLVDQTLPLESKLSSLIDYTVPLESDISRLIEHTVPLEDDAALLTRDLRGVSGKLSGAIKNPRRRSEIAATLTKLKDAACHLDLAARQINQILDKRYPLLHLILGRPGHIKDDCRTNNQRSNEEEQR